MTAALTDEQVELDTGTDDPDEVTHIVDQRPVERGGTGQDITTAMILGEPVTALCGYRWIPYRDHKGRPVCKTCIEEYGRIVEA